MKLFFTTILIAASFSISRSQEFVLDNPALVDRINRTLDLVYNFEFDEAYLQIDTLEGQLGNHPAVHFLRSTILYWGKRPFKIDTDPYLEYENELQTAIELAIPLQQNEALREEGEFYIMAGYGLLADFYSGVGQRMKAVGSAKKAYNSLKEGFTLKDKFPDFYFSTGLYNYYREKYPELHPFYKAFLWMFVSGDMALGLEQLKIASQEGVFLQREALIYLFHIYLRYENNPQEALKYSRILTDRFPGNYRFRSLHIETLVYNREYNIPDAMFDSLTEHEDIFYRLAGNLFKGLYLEQNNEVEQASLLLSNARELYEEMNREDMHYQSLIYTGMARLALHNGDPDKAKRYYKQALKTDPYVPVRSEAEDYLNSSDDG